MLLKINYWLICLLLVLVVFGGGSCKKVQSKVKQQQQIKLPTFTRHSTSDIFGDLKLDSADAKQQQVLKKLFHDYWVVNQVSGGVIISKKGKILLEGYLGYSNKDKKDTITANTPLHIASISKVLTAMVVLKLVDLDSLQLNQEVSDILPKFPYEKVRIIDLLNHRSGLPNYAYFVTDSVWDTNKPISNQEVLDLMIQHKFDAYNEPNTNFSYSNTNYLLLALVLEKITKKSYPILMKEILFDPLQMNHTFVFDIKDTAKVSQSYNYYGKRWDFDHLDKTYGDKNIYSTPQDLLKFANAMYSANFLSKSLKEKALQGYSYEAKGIKNYGLGIRMLEWNDNQKLHYHNGWWHGNYSTFVNAFNDSVVIIGLGNRKIRSVYSVFNFIGLFGDYPIDLDELNQNKQDTVQQNFDSIPINKKPMIKPKKTKAVKKDSTAKTKEEYLQEAPI